MTNQINNNIDPQQLRSGKIYGTRITKKPIKIFDKIKCECFVGDFFGQIPNRYDQLIEKAIVDAVVELEVPTNTEIRREKIDSKDIFGKEFGYIGDQVITNKAVVKNIEPIKPASFGLLQTLMNCSCYPPKDSSHEYTIGIELHNTVYGVTNKKQVINRNKN